MNNKLFNAFVNRVGSGLSTESAAQLGLKQGTAVGASLIDAHAGAVGTDIKKYSKEFHGKCFMILQPMTVVNKYISILVFPALATC